MAERKTPKTTQKTTKKKTKRATKKSGLGRGLDALLGSKKPLPSTVSDSELQSLPIEQLQAGQYQPRSVMDKQKLQELSESIKAQGIVQPIVVRQLTDKKYEIIAGERRWRAAQLARLHDVPVIVKQVDDKQTIAMALIENIQREDLNPLEESSALQRLIDEFQLTHSEAADAVGRSRAAVSNLLRLQELEPAVKKMLAENKLEMGHARCLLPLPANQQIELAKQIATKKLTVRQAENLVKKLKQPTKATPPDNHSADIKRVEQQLSEKLCTTVQLQHQSKGKGKLVIHYHNNDELEGILQRIK